ncbi:hypothetical protein M5D96_000526, partial [Drosophila gunungcola]
TEVGQLAGNWRVATLKKGDFGKITLQCIFKANRAFREILSWHCSVPVLIQNHGWSRTRESKNSFVKRNGEESPTKCGGS